MKNILFPVLIGLNSLVNAQNDKKFTDLRGYYFYQLLLGDSSVIYAPGIFSLPDRPESNIVFSPDGYE